LKIINLLSYSKDMCFSGSPKYNSSKYLGETIQSVQSQSFEDWEMIICDDCYQDNYREIIKTFQADDPHIRLITTKTNSGPAVARNTAIERSQGRFDDYAPLQFPGFVSAVDEICEQYNYRRTDLQAHSGRGYVVAVKE
jgi:hypothetical protein